MWLERIYHSAFGSGICYAVNWKDAEERGRSYGGLVLTWVSRKGAEFRSTRLRKLVHLIVITPSAGCLGLNWPHSGLFQNDVEEYRGSWL